MAACSGGTFDPEAGEALTGGVAADEPRAVLIAEAMLERGGNAADAATALFFGLTVTYPVAAGLGGGGACTIYDAASGKAESLAFLPREASAGGDVALPGALRGFAMLHSRFGVLRWAEVVRPAEELARFGFPASRALVRRIESSGIAGRADASLGELVAPLGAPVTEGRPIRQTALATTLDRIRTRGGGELSFGGLAADFLRITGSMGGKLSAEELRDYQLTWQPSSELRIEDDVTAYASPGEPSGGSLAANIWGILAARSLYEDAALDERAHLFAEAAAQSIAALGGNPPLQLEADGFRANFDAARHMAVSLSVDLSAWTGSRDEGTTSFVVIDGEGSAVTCGLTMNGAFGSGQMAPELGIVLAPPLPKGPAGWAATGGDFLAPIVIVDDSSRGFVLAGSASGGPGGPIALSAAVLDVLAGEATPREAILRPRLLPFARPDAVFVESTVDPNTVQRLRDAGHDIRPVTRVGRVNIAICRSLKRRPCQFAAESRGFGTATGPNF